MSIFSELGNREKVPIFRAPIFLAKLFALLFFFIWVRWTLPRFRYDQLMGLGWKVFLPLALVNVLIVAGVIMAGWVK